MSQPVDFPSVRNVTISGRIASGSSTLAEHLEKALGWKMLNGGHLFRKFTKEHGLSLVDTEARPDDFDIAYEEKIQKLLTENSRHIIESHLAGYDAQGIDGIFKVLVTCEDEDG